MKSILSQAHLEFEFQVQPDQRSLSNLWHGSTTLELIRSPRIMMDNPNHQQIDHIVCQSSYWLWFNDPKLCELNKEELHQLTVVGVKGIRYFEKFIHPKFKQLTRKLRAIKSPQ